MPWIEPDPTAAAEEIFPEWFLRHWSKLALTSGQADPFCCGPIWNLAYYKTICAGRRIFYAASGTGAVLFGEAFAMGGERLLVPLEDSWLYGQPLLGEDAPDLLAQSLPAIAEGCRGHLPLFLISGIIDPSPFSARLFLRHSPDFQFYREARMRQCSASLLGGVDGWLSRRSGNCRAKLRKSARRAKERGVEFERVRPNAAEAPMVYVRMLEIEEKSWKGLQHCGMTESPSAEFYAEMIRMLAKTASAMVIFATLDGEDIGFIFGGLAGLCYRGQQFSYSQEYADLSLGNLLQLEKIRWLCESGCVRYDMGPATGPRMEYKRHWTEHFQDFQAWLMRRAD